MIDYLLFGETEVRVAGSAVTLGGAKQRGVLAVLLAGHGTVVSTDRIIDAVWGSDVPGKAVASVRSYVANLRRVVTPATGEPRLTSRNGGYVLDLLDGDTVDLHRFDALVAIGREAINDDDPG